MIVYHHYESELLVIYEIDSIKQSIEIQSQYSFTITTLTIQPVRFDKIKVSNYLIPDQTVA